MSRLEKHLAELCALAKEVYPGAEIRISTESREGEDATLDVLVSEEYIEAVHDVLSPRRFDILLEEGCDIILWIDTKETVGA